MTENLKIVREKIIHQIDLQREGFNGEPEGTFVEALLEIIEEGVKTTREKERARTIEEIEIRLKRSWDRSCDENKGWDLGDALLAFKSKAEIEKK